VKAKIRRSSVKCEKVKCEWECDMLKNGLLKCTSFDFSFNYN